MPSGLTVPIATNATRIYIGTTISKERKTALGIFFPLCDNFESLKSNKGQSHRFKNAPVTMRQERTESCLPVAMPKNKLKSESNKNKEDNDFGKRNKIPDLTGLRSATKIYIRKKYGC